MSTSATLNEAVVPTTNSTWVQESALRSIESCLKGNEKRIAQVKEILEVFPSNWYCFIVVTITIAAMRSSASLDVVIKRLAEHGNSVLKSLPLEQRCEFRLGGHQHPVTKFFQLLYSDLGFELR